MTSFKISFSPYKIGIVLLIATSVLIGILYKNANNFQASVSCGASKVYWIDGGITMKRANLADGTNTESLVTGMSGGDGIALDISDNKVYWTDGGGGKIYRVDIDGDTGDIENIVSGGTDPTSIALDTVLTNQMYWTDEFDIWGGDFDGASSGSIMTGLAQPVEIVIDGDNDKMYWVDSLAPSIQRTCIGCDTPVDVVNSLQLSAPESIAIDTSARKIYWTDSGFNTTIQRADMDGTNEDAVDVVTGLTGPSNVEIDITDGKIYWLEGGKLRRANLDGSGVEDVMTLSSIFALDVRTACATPAISYYIQRGWCLRWDRNRKASYCDKNTPVTKASTCTNLVGEDGENGQWFGAGGKANCFAALNEQLHESAPEEQNVCCVCAYKSENTEKCAEHTTQKLCLISQYNCTYRWKTDGSNCMPKEMEQCIHRLQSGRNTNECAKAVIVESEKWNSTKKELEESCDVIRKYE